MEPIQRHIQSLCMHIQKLEMKTIKERKASCRHSCLHFDNITKYGTYIVFYIALI